MRQKYQKLAVMAVVASMALPVPIAFGGEEKSQDELVQPPFAGGEIDAAETAPASMESPSGEAESVEVSEPSDQQKSSQNSHLNDEERALVDEVSAYFNNLTTLRGVFDQQNQDGTLSHGAFYLKRPGRMRFEYFEPDQLTILSDGLFVMLNDRELESVDRYPMRETPLHLILKRDVDLLKDTRIIRVEHENGLIGVTAREEEGIAQGDLTLVFAGPRLELRHWMVEDVQGNRTLVSLRNVVAGATLAPELFIPKEYEFGIDSDSD